MEIIDTEFSVRNFGLISGGKGLILGGFDDPFAALSGSVENAGEILGEGQGILSVAELVLNNSGSIIASDGDGASSAILFSSFSDAEGVGSTINNSGLISGQGVSVDFTDKDDGLRNQGDLIGDVEFNGGNDVFNGLGGSIIGTVFGGAGDDSFTIDDALINLVEFADEGADSVNSTVTWTLGDNFEDLRLIGDAAINGKGNVTDNLIAGNDADNRLFGFEGDDFMDGNSGDDKIFGGSGADFLDGGTGADRLSGGKDADVLVGDGGDDRLSGGSGNDNLSGGVGDDILFGNQGKDSLNGGSGQDWLIGGRDKDILKGGDDADTFVFNRLNHSGLGANSDRIADFTAGEDRIDLSNLNLDLTFIGNTGFSGVAGEVRAKIGASITTVLLDSDGNGGADMRIILSGVSGLEALDFLL